MFRTADAFGVEKIIFISNDLSIIPHKIKRASRSAHRKIPFEVTADTTETLQRLKQEGYTIVALEIADTSIPLQALNLLAGQPVALIAGAR
jgi:tRNA G18 (ribose-2'-O)-methylase SpoU